jgi:hypothetical protein
VKHERVAGNTVAQRACVVKALHACQRSTDRIGVMAMRIVAVTAKLRFDTLNPSRLNTANDPVDIASWAIFLIHECVPSDSARWW